MLFLNYFPKCTTGLEDKILLHTKNRFFVNWIGLIISIFLVIFSVFYLEKLSRDREAYLLKTSAISQCFATVTGTFIVYHNRSTVKKYQAILIYKTPSKDIEQSIESNENIYKVGQKILISYVIDTPEMFRIKELEK